METSNIINLIVIVMTDEKGSRRRRKEEEEDSLWPFNLKLICFFLPEIWGGAGCAPLDPRVLGSCTVAGKTP